MRYIIITLIPFTRRFRRYINLYIYMNLGRNSAIATLTLRTIKQTVDFTHTYKTTSLYQEISSIIEP